MDGTVTLVKYALLNRRRTMLIHERPLIVLTSRIGCPDEDALDVTRKSGDAGLAFAPSWDILRPQIALRHAGLETPEQWERYKALYTAEMRVSYARSRPAWDALLARRRAVLCCYCNLASHPGMCHRLLLAQMLVKCGAVYLGEWQPGTPWLDLGQAEGGAA